MWLLLLSIAFLLLLLVLISGFLQAIQGSLSVLLQEVDPHLVVLGIGQELDVVVELAKSFHVHELGYVLKNIKTCPDDVLVLFGAALPYFVD